MDFRFRKVAYMADFQVITLIFIDLLITQGNLPSFDDFMDLKNAKYHPTRFSSTVANSGIEGTWTSVSEKWPTWQIFRSLLSLEIE